LEYRRLYASTSISVLESETNSVVSEEVVGLLATVLIVEAFVVSSAFETFLALLFPVEKYTSSTNPSCAKMPADINSIAKREVNLIVFISVSPII